MIKNRIRDIREHQKISQQELGRIVGCSRNQILRYENYESDTPTEVLVKIADYFNVSLDYLCDRQFNNNVGYIQDNRKNLVKEIVELTDSDFNNISAYVKGLKDAKKQS